MQRKDAVRLTECGTVRAYGLLSAEDIRHVRLSIQRAGSVWFCGSMARRRDMIRNQHHSCGVRHRCYAMAHAPGCWRTGGCLGQEVAHGLSGSHFKVWCT